MPALRDRTDLLILLLLVPLGWITLLRVLLWRVLLLLLRSIASLASSLLRLIRLVRGIRFAGVVVLSAHSRWKRNCEE